MKNNILVKPPVKEIFLNNKDNEKISYINLPEEYQEYSLEDDVKQGGVHYKNLLELTRKKNISSIKSPNKR